MSEDIDAHEVAKPHLDALMYTLEAAGLDAAQMADVLLARAVQIGIAVGGRVQSAGVLSGLADHVLAGLYGDLMQPPGRAN